HGGELNTNKTVYVISDCKKKDKRCLPTLHQGELIKPNPINTSFRYLGIYLTMDRKWSKQIKIMKNIINDWTIKIRNAGISSVKATDVFKTILLPRLDL